MAARFRFLSRGVLAILAITVGAGCHQSTPRNPDISLDVRTTGTKISSEAGALGGSFSQSGQHSLSVNNEIRPENEAPKTSKTNSEITSDLQQLGVDVRHSARGVVVNLPDLLFTPGRSELLPDSITIIKEIATVLNRAPHRLLSVEGHTDDIGDIEYNYRLSKSRADGVAVVLVNNGVARERLAVSAFGETTPLATNKTAEGREQNRRVEILILSPSR